VGIGLAAVLLARGAAAHIRLTSPTTRYPAPSPEDGSDLKSGPCGRANDSRGTDPSRVTHLKPGQTITVEWDETVPHPGHFRLALDQDGQDGFEEPAGYDDVVDPPVLPVLLDSIPHSEASSHYSMTVQLPDISCTGCTLQLIQVMTDHPLSGFLYHQCADLVMSDDAVEAGAEMPDGSGVPGAAADDSGSCACVLARMSAQRPRGASVIVASILVLALRLSRARLRI
jgi:hypothetical protein